jgi:hypothetical protein
VCLGTRVISCNCVASSSIKIRHVFRRALEKKGSGTSCMHSSPLASLICMHYYLAIIYKNADVYVCSLGDWVRPNAPLNFVFLTY